jgi:hypothetical protein
MLKHATSNRRVEWRVIVQRLIGPDDEFDLRESGLFRAVPSHLQSALLRIDSDDSPVSANGFGKKHRDVPDARADVENAHACLDAAFPDQPARQNLKTTRLELQAFKLTIRMAKKIFTMRGQGTILS